MEEWRGQIEQKGKLIAFENRWQSNTIKHYRVRKKDGPNPN